MSYKISIILPVFNVENYIRDSLDSIIKQTIGLDNLEVIMINDCSSDKSGEIIDEYASKYENFNAIHLTKNSGAAGKPRNIGIKKANGEYLMFLDPDDSYVDDACEKLYKKIVEEDVDIVFGRYNYIFENSKHPSYSPFGDIAEINLKTIDEDPRLFITPPSVWTKIFKRSFIENNKIEFPEGIPGQDLTFIVHAFLKAKGIIYLNNYFACNYNRIRDSKGDVSISRNKNKKNLMGTAQAYSETFNILKKSEKEDYFPFIFKGHLEFWTEGFIEGDLNSSEKMELLKEIGFLFEEFRKHDGKTNKDYLIPLFNAIVNNEYDKAIVLSGILNDFKVQLDTLNALKKEVNELRTFSGYLNYKTKNLSSRFKNNLKRYIMKFKSVYIELHRFYPGLDYTKLTIIIPYRKTNDPDREINLDITLRYLREIGIPNIIISEHSDVSTEDFLLKTYGNLFQSFKVVFNNAHGDLFNKSKAINAGVNEAFTPYITILDIDCLTKKKNMNIALALLEKGCDVVHPFNKRVTDIVDKEEFIKKYDFKTVKSAEQRRLWADGGIVLWNKHSFVSIGMSNEYFSGWGGEDNEIMLRADLCQLKQHRIDDTLYHLYHYRPQKRTRNNANQLEKIRKMKNKDFCIKAVNEWPWVIEAKKKFSY